MGFHVSARQGRHQPNPEMNMIPLIDVMLVLVIIFMVTAPLHDARREAESSEGQ
jgi:Biopolymer transport protein